jgi:hypothetical protein
LEEFFVSGRVVDFVIAFMAVECAVLTLHSRSTGKGLTLPEIAWNALAGIGLLLALRNALTGGPWMSTALWLLTALAGHLGDLMQRYRF